ncbi:MAG: hypothetical protein ACR2HG_12490 [Pyrinomonadaceae bacterium]
MKIALLIAAVFLLAIFVAGQDLPKEIRGYKVYHAKISVKNKGEKSDAKDAAEARVKIGEPKISDVSLNGLTLAIPAEINSFDQSGTIDFLVFRDFRVNDLKVEVEEYKESFDIKKNESVVLPKPIKITASVAETLRGALKELKESRDEWTITGRVFVFGRFKKSFLKFKRVVPVDINLRIKNPLKEV